MEKNAIQMEILLLTGTFFSSRQFCETGNTEGNIPLTPKQQLEAACWSGFMQNILPEICGREINPRLYIWKIKDACSFLDLELCESPREINKRRSIDPYAFISVISHN